MHVQSVQNHCFLLTNIQICGVFVAVVVVVAYRFSPNLVDTQERSPKRHWWLVTLLFHQDNCLHSFIREALISRNAKYLCSVLENVIRMTWQSRENEVRIIHISTHFKRKKNARKAQNIHGKLKKKCWNSKATWSEGNEIVYNSQVFSFAFDCNVSPIDGYKRAHTP